MEYHEFLDSKAQYGANEGFAPLWLPDFLFDFQWSLVEWAVLKGRAAIFADCGLGKTPMQLVWAENVVRKTNKPVMIITPLSVAQQTLFEAEKFGIDAHKASDATGATIHVTNYEKLSHFDPTKYAGVVCDESSILKSFDGSRKAEIVEFMRRAPYRLLCTATAAPNDYVELGTSSEALGYMGYMDVIARFFKNDSNTNFTRHSRHMGVDKWRFKGHAEQPFWKWICSWARAVRKPSDLGFCDEGFALPPLKESNIVVKASRARDGLLFDLEATNFFEERELTRRTIEDRCEVVRKSTAKHDISLIWCHLNDEGDLLEKIIPNSVQISGQDSDEAKEEAVAWFLNGKGKRRLISKPKIFGFGLNFQHCNHVTYFPTHSYEQYYQAVRRCWRFGQTKPVQVDLIGTDGDARVMANLQRKSVQAARMFEDLVKHMNEAISLTNTRTFNQKVEMPKWL